MDYGSLIRRSWQLTWRHRFVWGLGLFAGTTVGSCSPNFGTSYRGQLGSEQAGQMGPGIQRAGEELGRWLSQNLGLVVAAVGAFAALVLLLMVLSLIAQGGMARATADLALGLPSSSGQAWRTGRRLFWRLVGLWLILFGIGLVFVVVIGSGVGVAVAGGVLASGFARYGLIVLGVLLALAAFVLAIPTFIVMGVTAAFAQRAVAVDDVGPLAGLKAGYQLVRGHLGTSALAWLISVGLRIGAEIVVIVVSLVLLVPLGIIAAALFVATGLSAVSISYSIAAVLVWLILAWLLASIANTFFWNYWTLIYLNFRGRVGNTLSPDVPTPELGSSPAS